MGSKNNEARKCVNTNRASIENNRVGNIDMNIVAKTDLNFQGIQLQPVANIAETWLTASQIGYALQYADDKAVQRIYSRHAEEFTEHMTGVVKVTTPYGEQMTRAFSLRGAHLIAMFARTGVAKEFRRWVLDILDREVAHSPIAKQFTDDELQDLCWLWRASVGMASKMADVEPLLRVAEHRLAGAYHSMPREYSRVMNKSRQLLERETSHIHADRHTADNWRVLNNLRIPELH